MPPRLADRLRDQIHGLTDACHCYRCELMREAAAALDRTEALEQAAQVWAKAQRDQSAYPPTTVAAARLLALLPPPETTED